MDSDLNIIGKEIFFARTVGSRLSKGTLIVVVPNLFVSISATHLSPPGYLSNKNPLNSKIPYLHETPNFKVRPLPSIFNSKP